MRLQRSESMQLRKNRRDCGEQIHGLLLTGETNQAPSASIDPHPEEVVHLCLVV